MQQQQDSTDSMPFTKNRKKAEWSFPLVISPDSRSISLVYAYADIH
jgi:hypothetical protein